MSKQVSQIDINTPGEPLKSSRDIHLPGTEINATASPGGPLGLSVLALPDPCQVRHCPLDMTHKAGGSPSAQNGTRCLRPARET